MSHRHPIFARWYNFVTKFVKRSGYGELRTEVLAPARGRVLAVGLGPGYGLLHLPPGVESVVERFFKRRPTFVLRCLEELRLGL